MKRTSLSARIFLTMLLTALTIISAYAEEVDKGKIPPQQLTATYKQLPWNCPIWDESEAIDALLRGEKVLWVDTRPESFFKAGTIRNAVLLVYDKKDKPENTLTAESLAKALQASNLGADAKIVFFCQGPECHRSYNATYQAVSAWGYQPDQVIWFRAGYPLLVTAIKNDAKLKRKAKKLISDEGMSGL